jgi:CheY-like chemotaxis protein
MTEHEPILLAEDDENDVLLLRMALQSAGVGNPLFVVHDAEEAILYLSGQGQFSDRQRFPFPGLLITDLKMPRCSGFDLLKWLRGEKEADLLPAIVLTGSPAERDRRRALGLGAQAYWVKPSDQENLKKLAERLKIEWLAE